LDSAHTSEAAGWLDRLGAVLPSTDTIHSPHLSPPLLEKMAAYLHLRAREAQFAGHPIDGLAFRQQQLLVLKTAYGNTPRRELAKAYRASAESYLDLDSLEQAMRSVRQGYTYLLPGYDTTDLIPDSAQVYAENSFVELLQTQSRLAHRQYGK